MTITKTIILFIFIAVGSACGGGGGTSDPATQDPTPAPTPSPTPTPTTKQWSSTPAVLNTTEDNIYEPHLGYDQAGNGIAIWVSIDTSNNTSVMTSRYSASGQLWSTPTPIYANADPVKYLGGPGNEYWESFTGLAVADNGDAWAVWVVSTSGTQQTVMTSHFDSTSLTWSTPESLNADLSKSAHSVHVATNGSGQTVATWLEVDAQDSAVVPRDLLGVYASTYDDVLGSWSTPIKLDDGSQEYYAPGSVIDHSPQVVVQSGGKVVVVWHYYASGWGIWAAEKNSGTWTAAQQIHDGAFNDRELDVRLDENDNIHAVWVQRDATSNDTVLYSRLSAGSSAWSTPLSLEQLDGDAYAPKVAANNSGRIIVSWLNNDVSLDLYATQYDPIQSQWTSSETVAAGVSLSKQPTVAIDNNNNATILWQYVNLWYVHYTPTNGWETKASIPNGRHGMHFSLLPTGSNSLEAIWAYNESGASTKLYVSAFE